MEFFSAALAIAGQHPVTRLVMLDDVLTEFLEVGAKRSHGFGWGLHVEAMHLAEGLAEAAIELNGFDFSSPDCIFARSLYVCSHVRSCS